MVRPNLGTSDVTRQFHARGARWALAALAVTALALGGCGRKGGLDLPPQAAQNAAGDPVQEEPSTTRGNVFDPSYGTNAPPTAAKGRKKPFILDPLID